MSTAIAAPEPADRPEPTPSGDIVDLPVRRPAPALAGDACSESLWARRRDALIAERRHAHEAYVQSHLDAQRELDQDLERVDRKEHTLDALRGQPAVLVRRPSGAPVRVYHSTTGTCGRIWRRSNYDEKFESEITDPKIRRCTACTWHA